MERKRKETPPVMTNSAALRVLYDLAGGRMKTWRSLGRDLDANVEDIYKRNRPWPSGFGPKEYCRAFNRYIDEAHTSHYAALIAVKRSLEASNALTPEVKAIMDSVRPDIGEDAAKACLTRVMETIVETALPYNKVGGAVRGAGEGDAGVPREAASAGEHPAPEAVGRGAGAGADAAGCVGGECAAGRPGVPAAVGNAAGVDAAGCAGGECAPARPEGFGVAGCAMGVNAAGCSAAGSRGSLGTADSDEAPAGGPASAFSLLGACVEGLDAEGLLCAVVPASVLGEAGAAVDAQAFCGRGVPPEASARILAHLCGDSGLACRQMQRACSGLARRGAVDERAVDACVRRALGEQGSRAHPVAGQERLAPCPLGEAPGCESGPGRPGRAPAAPQPAEAARVRSLVVRYADGDAGRKLLCAVLLCLVGARGFVRVMTCPDTEALFER